MRNNYIKIFFSLLFMHQIFAPVLLVSEWWEQTNVPLLNDSNFYDIVGKDKYVVVDFFTKWCMYCKMMAPEYEKFYELYSQKREDVVVSKIECSINQKICMDYGIFSFPFIALFFPDSKKMKSVFKYRRIVDDFDKWVSLMAPKKNLKSFQRKEVTEENSKENNDTTKIEDYITKQFSDIKKDIKSIQLYINKPTNKGNNEIFIEKQIVENNGYEDDDIIEIKITPFFIVKFILFFLLLRGLWYYIKSFLFIHKPLPNNIHQKY